MDDEGVDVGVSLDDCVGLDDCVDLDDEVDFFLLNCCFFPFGLRLRRVEDVYILDRRLKGAFIFELL